MPSAVRTDTNWDVNFDTARREKLFRQPPKDRTAYPSLAQVTQPHIESFNAVFEKNGLLEQGIKDIGTKVFLDNDLSDPEQPKNRLSIKILDYFLDKSTVPTANRFATGSKSIFPAECRERHSTYRGKFSVRAHVKVNDGEWHEFTKDMGSLPLMVMSNRCHLEHLPPYDLVNLKEESEEFGGYFIVHGLEKLIRLLIVTKRNYPMAIYRPSFTNRGPTYSEYGVMVRSVRTDQTSQSNVLHYLRDGNVTFRFSWRKNEFLVPVVMILKALTETNDREIFEGIVGAADSKGLEEKQFVIDRVEILLRTYKVYNMHGKSKARAYIGKKFKPVLGVPEDMADEDAGTEFLRKIVLPHLGSNNVTEQQDLDKFRMMNFMIRKLYAFAEGECAADNPDAASNQEILLGGSLYGMIVKEQLEEWLYALRPLLLQWQRSSPANNFQMPDFWKIFQSKIWAKSAFNLGQKLEYFLATGNLTSPSGLDLQQVNGFTLLAEKLNFYRFVSHFRCVHRGSFFAQLKTTTVRKLLPESWGFLCPVHTPDGAPCGLLNHLAHKCKILTRPSDVSAISGLISGFNVTTKAQASTDESVVVQLDGRVLGYCSPKEARVIGDTLRYWKVEGKHCIPLDIEIGYVPNSKGGQYPGIYIWSGQARMIRPVKYLPLDKLDYVGPFEQPFMSIACTEPEVVSGDSTHVEFTPTNILSIVANMTPFSDFNQSPRNMYQCQMGKQSMGTPGAAIKYRSDNKVYRLQSGQTPVVRPPLHNEYGLDNFPNGTNAVVAVISYTGYDMDDAMIINKSAHERGFGYGTIYKTKKIDLEDGNRVQGGSTSYQGATHIFGFAPGAFIRPEWRARLDNDGLPKVGISVQEGDIIAASYEVSFDPRSNSLVPRTTRTEFHRYKDQEMGFIDEVRVLGTELGRTACNMVSIRYRIPRSPVIGDKFSSRHGQKGVCSQKWPTVDMPFSESGIVPDVIINPHAFPSRMTIGMFVESLAGKAGCLHGFAQDSTPWTFADRKGSTAVEYFGKQLKETGYNYYGNEPMYSGITGQELAADIYIGVVYYQRLRHMVNDKFQVRTTGPVNQLTGQPVKGRSKGGGIRVGEMERDSLLAHGTAFLLQDRLLNCSDYTKTWICRACGGFLSTQPTVGGYGPKRKTTGTVRCRRCAKRATGLEEKADMWEDGMGEKWVGGADTTVVAVPGVLKYLDVELAAMGVRMRFNVSAA